MANRTASKRASRTSKRHFELDPRYVLVGSGVLIVLLLVIIALTSDTSSGAPASTAVISRDTAGESASDGVSDGGSEVVQAASAPMPGDFTLPALGGGNLVLADHRGDYVLVNFWASWCPPCKAEMPDLHAYYLAHKAQNFTLFAINVGEDAATVESFIAAQGFTFPVGIDVQSMVFGQYGLESLPTSILIAPDGSIVGAWSGMIIEETLDRTVTPMLES